MIQTNILHMLSVAAEAYQKQDFRNQKPWRTKQRLFEIEMNARGFILVGVGMYSSVWRLAGRLYKINSNINGDFDGFYDWMKACMSNTGNPALPKFGDMVQDGPRYCVEVERMQPQYLVDTCEALYANARTNLHMRKAILLALQTCANMNDISRGVFDATDPDSVTVKLMSSFLDIHKSNIMRLNGQLVLNDPIAYAAEPISDLKVA